MAITKEVLLLIIDLVRLEKPSQIDHFDHRHRRHSNRFDRENDSQFEERAITSNALSGT